MTDARPDPMPLFKRWQVQLALVVAIGVLASQVSGAANAWLTARVAPMETRVATLEDKVAEAIATLSAKIDAGRSADQVSINARLDQERALRVRQWDRYEEMNRNLLKMQEQITTLRGQVVNNANFVDRWYNRFRLLERHERAESQLKQLGARFDRFETQFDWRPSIQPAGG